MTSHPGRRPAVRAAAVLVALTAPLVGCGSPGGNGAVSTVTVTATPAGASSPTDPQGRLLTDAEISRALATVRPAGSWEKDPEHTALGDDDSSSDYTVQPAACEPVLKASDTAGEAGRVAHGSVDLREKVAGGGAQQQYTGIEISSFREAPGDDLVNALALCPSFTMTQDGQSLTIQVQPLSVPRLGDRSTGFRLVIAGSTYDDVVIVRRGHNEFVAARLTRTRTDPAMLVGMVRSALEALAR